MRGDHTWLERTFESRTVYDIPMSNLVIVMTVLFTALRTATFRFSKPLATRLTDNGYSLAANKTKNHDFVVRKCQKYLYHAIYFSLMCPWCLSIALRWPNFDLFYGSGIRSSVKTRLYGLALNASGDIVEAKTLPLEEEYHLYMMVQLTWYLHNFLEDTLWDRHRPDYLMMVLHHIVTIALITLSVQGNAEIYGLYVIFPMDLMDFFLYCSKLYQICSSTIDGVAITSRARYTHNILTYTATALWIITRWIMYGSAIFQFHFVCVDEVSVVRSEDACKNVHIWSLLVLLDILFVLQVMWGVMGLNIAVKTFRAGRVQDTIFNTFGEVEKQKQKEQ